MKKIVCLMLALSMLFAVAGAESQYAGTELVVFNWFDYIDPEVIDIFTQETGIKVKYANFTTNEEMFTKMEANPGAYDVIFPSDYIMERLIADGKLEKLDMSVIPEAQNLSDWLKKPDYDPEGEYSVAYMWGTVGIIYNSKMVSEPITSWTSLFSEEYKGSVIMMDSYRDTIGVTLRMLGYSVNSHEGEALEAARDTLIQQKRDGIVKAYQLDETKDKMIAGEAALAIIYSGDALYSIGENEDLRYVVPDEGSNVWIDGMCIPKGSKNVGAAMEFINFMCREDIARMNLDYIWYSTPIQSVVDNMSEEEKNDLTLNPSEDILARCEFFHDLAEYIDLYEEMWSEIRLAR